MSVRHLDRLFQPASVAVIGASDRPQSIGATVLRNLLDGGFAGPVWPVNPKRETVAGQTAYASLAQLPQVPDLAVVCTPASTVPGIVAELGARGGKAAVVLSAGLAATTNADGHTLQQAMLDAARPHLLRILGPNCVGLLVPGIRLNASFAHTDALPGRLAFVSQSGALATALLDWAKTRGIGFSHFISMGDSADVDFGDVLDYLGSDGGTRAILMYVESVKAARKFMSAARAAARNKPVLLVKAGRAPEGAKAAASHTGALTGSDAVFDAAVRRAGMLRVNTLTDLFDAAETLARAQPLHGERLAIMTNGGGAGVLAADALALAHGRLAELDADCVARLDAVLPANWSRANPVDIIGDAPAQRYVQTLEVLLEQPQVDAVLFMHAPTAIVPSEEIAQACTGVARRSTRPVLSCWLGGQGVARARQLFAQAGLPDYDTPEQAVGAFMQLVDYRRHQALLMEVPPTAPEAFTADRDAALEVIQAVLAAGRDELTEPEAKALMASYGIPVVETRSVGGVEDALTAAQAIGYPVVLKILSPDISHKSDVGGVALDLRDAEQVEQAARGMLARVQTLRPDARVTGFTVQAMIRRPHAHELIVGAACDPVFGPVILFGQGGTAVEVIADRAVSLPPLNLALARDLVGRTRVARLLAGYRDRAPVNHDALYLTLLQVSQMVCDLPQIAEIDINPLLADDHGVVALDARVRVQAVDASAGPAWARLAIRPYPSELITTLELRDRTLVCRPIRPEDGPALQDFYRRASPEDLRLRFFLSRREIPHTELARYSQIDYDRDMTFVAVPVAGSTDEIFGEARAVTDPDNLRAEFAIQIDGTLQRQGLGHALLQRMIDYLRERSTVELVGECLPRNAGMANLARELGFAVTPAADGDTLRLHLRLQDT